MKKKSIILLLLFIGAFIYLLMCLFINNDYAYSNGELALDNLNEDGIMFNAKNQKHFICANVKNINIQNHIVYGFIKYEHSTLPIGEPGYFKNDEEANRICDGYCIIYMKEERYLSALTKEEYEAELKRLQIREKAMDFFVFLKKNGEEV